MNVPKRKLALAFSIVALSSLTAMAADNLDRESQDAVANFKKTDSTLQGFMDTAVGYAVFPSVGKGGFIVGGAHGEGLVYEKMNIIGKATMSQASVGAQIGGQTFAEIICFETAQALEDFKASKYEMRAEVSAVMAAEGAAKTAKYSQGVAVFTLPKKGLMAQAAIGGQKFKFEPIAAGGAGTEKGTEKGK